MGFFLTLAIATILHVFLWIYLFVKRERGVLMPAGFLNWRTYVFGLFVLYFITSMTWCGVWLGSLVGGKAGGWIGGIVFFLIFFRDYGLRPNESR